MVAMHMSLLVNNHEYVVLLCSKNFGEPLLWNHAHGTYSSLRGNIEEKTCSISYATMKC